MRRHTTLPPVIGLTLAIAFAFQAPTLGRTFTWNIDANGDWERRANWSPIGIPDSGSDDVVFGRAITRPRTVTITSATGVDVQAIMFDSPHAYTIDSTGRVAGVNLTSVGRVAAIDVVRGSHELEAIVQFLDAVNLDVAAGARLEFSNIVGFNGHVATTTGDGEYRFNSSGAVTGVSGSLVGQAGTLSGIGTIGANLQNIAATVAPGTDVPGVLTVAGNYVQGAGGRARLRIGGVAPGAFDRLNVFGTATLGGRLDVEFTNGFTPQLNQTIPLITAQRGVDGMFQTVSFSNSPGRFAADFVSGGNGTQLRFVQPDTSNQLGGVTLLANWFNPASWTGGVVPDSTNVVALRNTILRDQLVFIPGASSAFLHDLSIQGDGTNTMSLDIQSSGNLSASHQVTVGPLGALQLSGGNLATSRVRVEGGGLFSGSGRVIGDVVVGTGGIGEAILSPGTQAAAVGTLEIEGDYEQASNGTLSIDILGTANGQYDTIHVLGRAEIGGTLTINLADFDLLTPGVRLAIVTSTGLGGGFGKLVLNTEDDDHYGVPLEGPFDDWIYTCLSFDGDMNCDGVIDGTDLQGFALALVDPQAFISQFHFAGSVAGDMDDNGSFDFDDIELFAAALPGGSAAEVLAAIGSYSPQVPEPSAIAMGIVAVLLTPIVRQIRSASKGIRS